MTTASALMTSEAPGRIRYMTTSALKHGETTNVLRQLDEREISQRNGSGPWTVVYDSWHDSGHRNGGRFAAFSAPNRRERALQSAGWDMFVGGGFPGFSQHHEGGEWVSTYHRNVDGPNLEPLILVQQMYGVVPDAYLISEEFRLLMHLWEDRTTGNFYSVGDDGSKISRSGSPDNVLRSARLSCAAIKLHVSLTCFCSRTLACSWTRTRDPMLSVS